MFQINKLSPSPFPLPLPPSPSPSPFGGLNWGIPQSASSMQEIYTAISTKVVGKSARDNPERHCGWFWVLCSSKKIWKNWHERPWECVLSAKGKQPKYVRQLQSSGTVYWSYPILPFGIVACTFFPTTFLEIAVNSKLILTATKRWRNNQNRKTKTILTVKLAEILVVRQTFSG